MTIPLSQQLAAERFIDWGLISARLLRFPAIGRSFPLGLLRAGRNSPPYYCHYMAWRLGAWRDEASFVLLERLLLHAEGLENWSSKSSMLTSSDFAEYWSLVWELQVAEFLSTVATRVEWNPKSGPDLIADILGDRLFVECYSYRKSFGLALFVEEVLARVGSDLLLDRRPFLRLSLPQNEGRQQFLHDTLSPVLDEVRLEGYRKDALTRHPVLVSKLDAALRIYVSGEHADLYDPSVLPQGGGDWQDYRNVAFGEMIRAKAASKQLKSHHPNIVFASYLASADAQLAASWGGPTPDSLDTRSIEGIDAVAVAAVGIDRLLLTSDLTLVFARTATHPAHLILNSR
jgi:hypothetical protein